MTKAIAQPECAAVPGSWCERIWNTTGLSWLAENADQIVAGSLRVLLILVIAFVARFLVHRAIDRLTRLTADGSLPKALHPLRERAEATLGGRTAVARRGQRAKSIGSLLKSITSFVVFVVALILILSELGIDVAPLLASAGIAGIALGFGAQNLVKDFLSGIFMMLEDQYGVGDTVDLGSATGTVTDVGLRVTTIRGADGTVWYVRNGEVLRVGNSSQGEAVVTVDLPLSYRADAGQAGEIALARALEVAASEEFAAAIVKQPELQGITAMTADSVTIRLVATVRAGDQWAFGRAMRGAIKEAFDQAEIAAPATDYHRYRPGAPDLRTGEAT